MKPYQRIVIVFFAALMIWVVWPFLPLFLGCESGFRSSYVVNSYATLQALIAVVGLPLIYVSYNNSKQRSREDEFKRIELQIVKGLYPMMRDFQDAMYEMKQKCLDRKVRKGLDIAVYLYDNYRVQELELLRDIRLATDKEKKEAMWLKLMALDKKFAQESGCLLKPHQLISVALNWAKAQVEYMQNLYSGDDYVGYDRKIEEMRARILNVFKSYTVAGHRFLLAKYRHHEHNMDKRNYSEGEKRYRGFYYADYLFAYVRTLAHVGFKDKNTADRYWEQMRDNYEREPNGIGQRSELWINSIHIIDPAAEGCSRKDHDVQLFAHMTREDWMALAAKNEWDWYS